MPWPVQLYWKEDPPVSAGSPRALEEILDGWDDTGFPGFVRIACADAGTIGIGLGAPWSVVTLEEPGGGRRTSVGDPKDTLGTVDFYYGGSLREFPRRNTIRPELARQIVREFVETGELPPVIEWERG